MSVDVHVRRAQEGPSDNARDDIMLMWTDPPFGTGKTMTRGASSYADPADIGYVLDGITAWLPFMHADGTVVICCDYRLAPWVTGHIVSQGWVYRGEVIWEFGLGRPRTSWWPVRHNNLLTFTRTETSGKFDENARPRERRLAPVPGYTGDKASGSVWNYTMNNVHPDRVGYPNQKPIEIISPFILAHTQAGDVVADPFCGSGSTGVAAMKLGRKCVMSDESPDAVATARSRVSITT